ncbi:MAG: hypothetical protein OEL54_04850 [Flavobacteriaceae bacterium]|nr:hypothetical protein [Flavobacteriaceae bacterium]
MKVLLIFVSFLLVLGTSNIYAGSDCFGNGCMPKEIQDSCIEKRSSGCLDWTNGIIYATGEGAPSDKAKNSSQKRLSARRAAEVIAQRNLLTMIEETNISSSTTVKMGMVENDEIKSSISGKLKQFEKIDEKVKSDGSVVVTLKMYLKDIMSVFYNNEQFKEKSSQTSQKQVAVVAQPVPIEKKEVVASKPVDPNAVVYGGNSGTIYTGLIIDARGSGVKPAMSPKVYDTDGKEVYGSAAVERSFALKLGIVGYAKDVNKAKSNDRVKGNPLILKANLKQGAKSSDLTITKTDADLLRQVEQSQTFLREARVLILI